jgi:predicted ATPase
MHCESVHLFVDRAQGVRPDFQVTSANAAAIAQLCARLEGIPLAFELAASRAQMLTPAQILAHLERRFDFLISRRRDASARHRTLRAAIDWSYQLLAPELQRFFARLSLFRGGWDLEAAASIADCGLQIAEWTEDEGRQTTDGRMQTAADPSIVRRPPFPIRNPQCAIPNPIPWISSNSCASAR